MLFEKRFLSKIFLFNRFTQTTRDSKYIRNYRNHMQPNFMWCQKFVWCMPMHKWSDRLPIFSICPEIRKTIRTLPSYLEFYLQRPLPEYFLPIKLFSIAIKQISTSLLNQICTVRDKSKIKFVYKSLITSMVG